MKRSLRIEIVASFATLVVALGLVGGYALVRQAQAVAVVALENHGYLPLSLTLSEANANQNSMDTLLERFVEVPDRAAWGVWITGARRTRRAVIHHARTLAQHAQLDAQVSEDHELLTRVDRALERVEMTYRDDERDFSRVFDALAANNSGAALSAHRPLFAREEATQDVLRALSREVEARMEQLADDAKREQPRTLRVLSVVTVLALGIGLMTLLSAYRALRPLKLLIERVRAVASGDLSPRRVPARHDEIGELAREFDRMVEAVKLRDTALREKADEIRRAEEHLEQVVATLRAAVMVVSKEGVLTSANPAAQRIADAAMTPGTRFRETPFGTVEDIQRAVAATCAGERSGTSLFAITMGKRALDVAVATFVAPGGVGSGALVVADDVTEREQARARLLQNERLAAIGRMAAHVTHEVRNPLSSMALNAEMLADEARGIGEPGREVQRLVTAIQQEIDRLTAITEEYLRVARLPRPRLEREDIVAVVEDAINFVGAEFARAGIALNVTARGPIPPAMIDEGQIRQALLNLLRNAREVLESQPAGKRSVRITVSADRDGVEVALADSGPGIRPEIREHLFELFFTTKERGTGLGLPLTREVIAAHGGTITVTAAAPEEGGGAKFVLWLPSTPARQASPDGGTRDAA